MLSPTVQPGAPGRLHTQSAEDLDLLVPARFLATHDINSHAHGAQSGGLAVLLHLLAGAF